MGIEPTNRTVYVRLSGFEDRGHHQVYKHFPGRHPAPAKTNHTGQTSEDENS
jgi:hypothetical protein